MVTKYFVAVHKTITEYWKVEAENEDDARMLYENGEKTSEKEHDREISVYED